MKFVKEFVVPALVLTLICIVVSAALAFTYETTKPVIEAARQREADAARIEVLPEGDKFTKLDVTGEGLVEAYSADNGAGYAITANAPGYGGPVNVIVGIKADGTIAAVKMLSHNETPGIGSNLEDPSYAAQYQGKDHSLDGVEGVSGATVTSGAFKNAVKNAFLVYGEVAGVEMEAPLSPEEQIFPGAELTEVQVEGAKRAYLADGQGVILVMETQGYSGAPTPMEVYVGFGTDLKIAGVALGENSETSGLGTQVGDAAYTDQYKGKDSTDGIEAVSHATESSDGFKKAVGQALELRPALEPLMAGAATAKYASVLPGVTEVTPFENENAVEAVVAPGVGIVAVTQSTGYNDSTPIQVMVGISEEGVITGVKVVVFEETEGIGTQVLEDSFLGGWTGKAAGEKVAAVSGATLSSEAFQRCVEKAFQVFEASKGA